MGEHGDREPSYQPDDMNPATYVDRLIQHSPGVEIALRKWRTAEGLDTSLRGSHGNHALSKRFVIDSEGTETYPFRHKKITLEPIHVGIAQSFHLTSMILRVGLRGAKSPDTPEMQDFSGAIVVTFCFENGTSSDHVLTDTSWDPIGDAGDLLIEGGVLKGALEPGPESPFSQPEFEMTMDSMEPALQINTGSTAA